MWINPKQLVVGDIFKCKGACEERHLVTKIENNGVWGTYQNKIHRLFLIEEYRQYEYVLLLTTKLSKLFYGENT